MTSKPVVLEPQFEDIEQQRLTYTLGMWVFLATEVLFFGGMFMLYSAYRVANAQAFHEASGHLNIVLGTINTAVLLLSSLTMALGVYYARAGEQRRTITCFIFTMLLGIVFLAIKGTEWMEVYHEHLWPGKGFQYAGPDPNHVQLFFSLYYVMTGFHALHMVIGVAVVGLMAILYKTGRLTRDHFEPIDMTGLYWHFVDIVWIFLFPMLYLIGRAK